MRHAILFLLLAVSAAATATAGEFYNKHEKSAELQGEATDDMALVYVMRPSKMAMGVRTWAFSDDELIVVSRARGYSYALVPPGKRLIWSKAENTSSLELEFEAGQTYFLKQKILPGFGKARVKLMQVDEAEGRKLLRKCRWAEPTDAGRERAAEIAANRIGRARNKVAER